MDCRGPDQFAAGHIDGSINLPQGKVLDPNTKVLKSVDERKQACKDAGVDLDKPISFTCTGGITASVVYCAFKEICTSKLSVYDGSWSEFSKNM